MIAKAIKITGLDAGINGSDAASILRAYTDAAHTSDYAKDAEAACVKAGIITGRNGNVIAPKDDITRAETAVIVRNLLKKSG